jgi:hypothetical protein
MEGKDTEGITTVLVLKLLKYTYCIKETRQPLPNGRERYRRFCHKYCHLSFLKYTYPVDQTAIAKWKGKKELLQYWH